MNLGADVRIFYGSPQKQVIYDLETRIYTVCIATGSDPAETISKAQSLITQLRQEQSTL